MCFRLHGYPDWYKQLKKDKGVATTKTYTNMANNPFEDMTGDGKNESTPSWMPAMAEMMQQELSKLLKHKGIKGNEQVNFA